MWNLSICKMAATLASETSVGLHGVKLQNAVACVVSWREPLVSRGRMYGQSL